MIKTYNLIPYGKLKPGNKIIVVIGDQASDERIYTITEIDRRLERICVTQHPYFFHIWNNIFAKVD